MSKPPIYDRSRWHYQSERYPQDLPCQNAHTHGGFYLAWLFERGLVGREFIAEHGAAFDRYQKKKISAGALYESIGETLDSRMLTDIGKEFTEEYYEEFYIDDYWMAFEDGCESFYQVGDTLANRAMIFVVLDQAFKDWQAERA